MADKYLLYLDILGFSDLVRRRPAKIRQLYAEIDSLNVHRHSGFRTIVFSDTVLIYNLDEPRTCRDHEYIVMYSCEFAQDLLYRLIGKGVYFRALLRYGEFEHRQLKHLEAYHGLALVNAYGREKSIKCTGLFIDRQSQQHNRIFPVARYDRDFRFVYLNQSLDRLCEYGGNSFPIEGHILEEIDLHWSVAKDVAMLKDIFWQKTKHPSPRVRKKHSRTWRFYERRYPQLIQVLVRHRFQLQAISATIDWQSIAPAGWPEPKGDDEISVLFETAHQEAHKAATGTVPVPMRINGDIIKEGMIGFAWVTIRPGNSPFARWLKKYRAAERDYPSGCRLSISDYGQSYERKRSYAEAFAEVLRASGIDAFAHSRLD